MNFDKKRVFVNGNLLSPLQIGERAIIAHDEGYTMTSSVVSIKKITKGFALFETCNSIYCVALGFKPAPAAAAVSAMAA